SSNDHTVFTRGFDVISFQQLHNTKWRCRHISRPVQGHSTHIRGRKAVHVFFRFDLTGNLFYRNMLRQRQLNDQSINIRVFIDLFYLFQQFLFAYLLLQPHQSGGTTHLLTGLYFGSHIGLAGSVIAHQHRCQMGNLAPFSFDLHHPLRYLVFYLFGSFLSVYDDWHSYTVYFGSLLSAFFSFSFHFNTASRTRNAHYLKSRSQTNTHSVAAVDRGPSLWTAPANIL